MIKYTNADKTLVVPSGLGNFGQSSGSGGGVTPQQAAEIASAVTEAAIDEYDTEIQVDLEELRDAISASTGTLLDLATIAAMSVADRVALFDEVFEKASNGEKIYIKGLVQEETIRTAILPLVSYRPETNPVLHQGGNLYFAAKGDTDNVYFHIGLTSDGSIDPTSGNIIKRNIYNLPTASAEVKGGVRIGSGLTMTQDTLSVDTTGLVTDGDLAPFIVQQSANTENIATLSAATEAISESLGNYATTATTNELATAISGVSDSLANYATTATTDALSAVTSALTENLEALSAVTSGMVSEQDIIYDYNVIKNSSKAEKQAYFVEISGYKNTKHKVWLKEETASNDTRWYLGSKFMASDIYFVANDYSKLYSVYLTSTGSFNSVNKTIQYQLSAGSGISISNDVVSVKIGEGLAFSGNTLVVSGGTGGGKSYVLNTMSQQELAALYSELSAYRTGYAGVSSGFPAGDYAFYINVDLGDGFQGIVPMTISMLHPDDYGGAVFFTGVVRHRNYNVLYTLRFIIASDGSTDSNINDPSRDFCEPQFSNENFSWTGNVSVDLDNNLIKRGDDVLSSGGAYDSFGSRDGIVSMIENGGRYEPANGTIYNPQYKITVIDSGVSKTYYKPVLYYEDITPVTIGGQEFSTRFTFIYTKEDGSRFKFSFMTNGNQYGADFQYQALS